MVKTALPLQRAWVRFLVGELRFPPAMKCSQTINKYTNTYKFSASLKNFNIQWNKKTWSAENNLYYNLKLLVELTTVYFHIHLRDTWKMIIICTVKTIWYIYCKCLFETKFLHQLDNSLVFNQKEKKKSLLSDGLQDDNYACS